MSVYLSGIIEGFFGRSWSWEDRRSSIDLLSQGQLNSYVYAPKSDPYLRRSWADAWPRETFLQLQELGAHCRGQGVLWGVGLSPFEAYLDYDETTRSRLRNKLREIDRLQPDILCVLFDDMRGDLPGLAGLQARMVADIAANTVAGRVIMCPTYYSEDPVLERVFGAMPDHYWRDLGRMLDPAIDFFWTGDRVCSAAYSSESVCAISEAMGRAPVLWDNYPVNDSQKMSRRLHLRPFSGRPVGAPNWLRGHLVNPMNQACLSRIVLSTLSGYEDFAGAVRQHCPEGLARLLERDIECFSGPGLDAIDGSARQALLADYGGFDHPCAREVIDWLQGGYAFDPACLTDT